MRLLRPPMKLCRLGVCVILLLLPKSGVVARAQTLPQTCTPTPTEQVMITIREGRTQQLREWLECKNDPDTQDYAGTPIVVLAARLGRAKVVELLLEHNAAINNKDAEGLSALMWAARAGHTEVVRVLLEKGASTAERSPYGFDAEDEAKARRFHEIRALLNPSGHWFELAVLVGFALIGGLIVPLTEMARAMRQSNVGPLQYLRNEPVKRLVPLMGAPALASLLVIAFWMSDVSLSPVQVIQLAVGGPVLIRAWRLKPTVPGAAATSN